MMTLPDALFEGGYNAFRTPNATDEEMDLMPWALDWKGRLPYTLPRGLLFQDGRRMGKGVSAFFLVRSFPPWTEPFPGRFGNGFGRREVDDRGGGGCDSASVGSETPGPG